MRADLALIGFGHVGRRFARLLDEQRARLREQHDLECRIVGIATRQHGVAYDALGLDGPAAAARVENGGSLPASHDARSMPAGAGSLDVITHLSASDAPLRVVVESTTLDIGAGQPAIAHVVAALSAACDVITANKGPAAFAYDVCGLAHVRPGGRSCSKARSWTACRCSTWCARRCRWSTVLGFRGVVNSTTNHILTALEDGETFAPALARMQAVGIAEADPSLDVDGWDAAAKAAALANVLMDARHHAARRDRDGIGPATAAGRAMTRRRAGGVCGWWPARRDAATRRRSVAPRSCRPTICSPVCDGTANALVLQTDLLARSRSASWAAA